MSEMTPCDNPKTTLRPMTEADLDMVREWRNAPAVREKMFTTHEINPDEHRRWFQQVKSDSRSCFYIAQIDQHDYAMVSFTNINRQHHTAEWGFYKAPAAPAGVGLRMLHAALNIAFNALQLQTVTSRVLTINDNVLHLHRKLGFVQVGQQASHSVSLTDAVPYINFQLTKKHWQHRESCIRQQIQPLQGRAAS
ncbi:UDP-4-amino-4,6-dideoxy-N-acetyl-beta-L-altrosamine N-acetyltransferase [Enterovibrio sp. 27052020O]|uniref:UDP-4-amino-4, 6-dideoxy-N-acetyl-beta-L-altrosamine N-acetyltransferase n=1 Tax=Enterovibrio sp. 27052020O TaxID=3241166 RepID=UPI003890F453